MPSGNKNREIVVSITAKRVGRWGIALAGVFVPAIAAGALTLPYTFTSGTAIRAAEVNANFAAIKAKVDALEAAKPFVIEKYDAGPVPVPDIVNQPLAAGWWIVGTSPTSVVAGSKVFLHSSFDLTGSVYWYDTAPCYRVGTTVTLGEQLRHFKSTTLSSFYTQDVFTIPTTGSYEFGLCADIDVGGAPDASARRVHTAAVIWGP
jgi:hypothetical protein